VIKAMEDEHFNGKKIAPESSHGDSVMAYFQSELKKQLKLSMRLTEFKVSRSLVSSSNQTIKISKE